MTETQQARKTRMTEAQFQTFRATLQAVTDEHKARLEAIQTPDQPKYEPTPEQEAMFERVSAKMKADLEQTLRDSVQIVETEDESDVVAAEDGSLIRRDRPKAEGSA